MALLLLTQPDAGFISVLSMDALSIIIITNKITLFVGRGVVTAAVATRGTTIIAVASFLFMDPLILFSSSRSDRRSNLLIGCVGLLRPFTVALVWEIRGNSTCLSECVCVCPCVCVCVSVCVCTADDIQTSIACGQKGMGFSSLLSRVRSRQQLKRYVLLPFPSMTRSPRPMGEWWSLACG